MDNLLLAQLRQEMESIVKKKIESFSAELKDEIAKTKEYLKQQTNINKNQERDKKHIEEDLSLLRIVVIEQKGAIEKLKKEVSLLKRSNRHLPSSNQFSALSLKRSFIVNDFPKQLTNLKEGRKSANAERDSSLTSLISGKLKKAHFSAHKHSTGKNPQEKYNGVLAEANVSPNLDQYSAQLNSLLKSGQINNNLRDTLMSIGEQLKNSNKLKESLKYYMKANEVCIKLKQEQSITQAQIAFWIACNLSELGNYNQAIRFYLDELTIREGMNEIRSENVAATLNNIGHNYYRKKDYQKAVEYFQKAVEMQTKIKGRQDSSVALYLKNLAQAYFVQQSYKLTQKYCLQSLEVYQKIGEVQSEYSSWCHFFLSVVYFKAGRYYESAKEILESGKAFILNEKKGEFKEMLHCIARKSQDKKEVISLVLEAANTIFERYEGKEMRETLKHR